MPIYVKQLVVSKQVFILKFKPFDSYDNIEHNNFFYLSEGCT